MDEVTAMAAMSETKPPRRRSPKNPAIPLEPALARAESLYRAIDVRAVPVKEAAAILGYCARSSVARRLISALKEFGLVTDADRRDQRTVTLTTVAAQLLNSSAAAHARGATAKCRTAAKDPQ